MTFLKKLHFNFLEKEVEIKRPLNNKKKAKYSLDITIIHRQK